MPQQVCSTGTRTHSHTFQLLNPEFHVPHHGLHLHELMLVTLLNIGHLPAHLLHDRLCVALRGQGFHVLDLSLQLLGVMLQADLVPQQLHSAHEAGGLDPLWDDGQTYSIGRSGIASKVHAVPAITALIAV